MEWMIIKSPAAHRRAFLSAEEFNTPHPGARADQA
jgi:hypothetical protein